VDSVPAYRGDHRQGDLRSPHQPLRTELQDHPRRRGQGRRYRPECGMSKAPITTIKTVVDAIDDGGDGIKVFTLVDPDRWELPPFLPGAHIDLHLPGKLVRTYSLCNDPVESTRYVIAVKREAAGRGGSIALHDQIGVGDTIGVSLPRGGLALDGASARYVFVA